MINSEYLNNLNNAQKEAVLYLDGPLLIVAGAGSGKTKVLTSRIAHIINEKKAFPNQILSVTFTNKAAKEMQNRVSSILNSEAIGLSWLGTFHSICAKLLRKHAPAAGLTSNFTIIDTDDQVRLIKNICKAENIDIKQLAPKFILSIIDRWKNKGFYPDEVVINKNDIFERTIRPLYKIYQQKLLDLNACDFGDLILHVVKILEKNQDIRDIYSNNFKYILVDEYQDTNYIQSRWLNLLSEKHKNLCCVGDDDQSIYSWRGAEIKNFLEFDQVYKNSKVIRLEENYRSSQNILSVASNLIANNQNRVGKTLKTTMEEGDLVKLNCFKNGKDEAIGVSDEIEKKLKKKYSFNNIAILVRAIFQTREFEERFLKIGLPYRILGGTKFYERAEIKDCVAYLRLIHQPKDDLAFDRIVNNPKRAIGESTIKLIHEFSKINAVSLEIASKKLIEENLIKPKTKIGLSSFLFLMDKWRNDINIKKINHVKLLQLVLDESGYSSMLKNKKDLENENRLENIKELLSAMKDFDNLENFLEHVALATSVDQDWDGEKVNMMTMHGSKGLEFDVVFLPGWEEGLFPHQKSIEEKGQNGLEEERRLAYVGITRAKKKALISFAMNRFYQGNWIDSMASRFIEELPEKFLEKNSFFDDSKDNEEDFEFNQDFEIEEGTRSPGWIRYQKRIK
ncbi:UvrD-helicase domain-containing protein [Candidatus Pelagibacter ubique]|jgi:DNA helicase-2/ATP-dependent DNA helicase PcrA|nr:UvrD-helicase domain-containing protein [Candidatus Pelagibacter ubique]MDC0392087.1 UvrD-helicase domain-containing protein [Candidatus Pelagibacter ubique]MDC0484593.1 UvrD-helicase domain-containing protein [Candidatus Pelagibacter ubique]MDC0619960.1 UvrD-helicase domain-containing protein [Candidatus Pelagibacter ubique]MDC0927098.1 UvrD-helicase domain-containing protein [Candidatus Pelagibacter ubique]